MSQQQIRMATDADREAIESIWNYCFHDGESFQRWYFSQYYRKDECIVGCVNDRPVASLQVIDLPTVVRGRCLRAGYIVGVDCLPEYRGLGFTRRLMEEALNHYAPVHGLQLLHLMPFEADFYEPYGFVFSDYHFNMDLDIEEFYRSENRNIAHAFMWQAVNVDALEQMVPQLDLVYDRCMARYDMYVMRKGLRRWRALADDLAMEGGFLKLLLNEHKSPVGLLAYSVKEDALFIREALAIDSKARQAIYYFIASHRSQVKKVQWSAPEDEAIVFRRKKDKAGVMYQPFMMNAILDPMILPLFASAVPSQDLDFMVKGYGAFRWPKGGRCLEQLTHTTTELILDCSQLTQMVFDRSWAPAENDDVFALMAALFTKKTCIFNNEYF